MTCEEFKDRIVGLFDKNPDSSLTKDMARHIKECAECKTYYNDFRHTVDLLTPKVEMERKVRPAGRMILRNVMVRAAVVAVVFILGIAVGMSNFFSTDVSATSASSFVQQTALPSMRNIGNAYIEMLVRTTPNENFAYLNPKEDFVKITMRVIHQNDSTFWRVEKAGGRTVVFDGKSQYMWTPNQMLMIRGSKAAGFLENFVNYLYPEKLLELQIDGMKNNRHAKCSIKNTDGETVVTTEREMPAFLVKDYDKSKVYRLVTDNVFSSDNNLLKEVRMWMCSKDEKERTVNKTLIMKSAAINYNVDMDKKQVVMLPTTDHAKWSDISGADVVSKSELKQMRKESATDAARHIMEALTTGKTEGVKEFPSYSKSMLPLMVKKMQGYSVIGYGKQESDKDYPGVFVTCTLKDGNGNMVKVRLALRRDNEPGIWELDGGL